MELERPRSAGSQNPPLRSTGEVGHDLPGREVKDAQPRVGWQPSRFLTDRTEAERTYALAEQLGSVNAAATELGTTWPSLRKAFTHTGEFLGMAATGKSVQVPYCLVYDLRDGKIAGLRAYVPIELFAQQLG